MSAVTILDRRAHSAHDDYPIEDVRKDEAFGDLRHVGLSSERRAGWLPKHANSRYRYGYERQQ